MDRDVQEETQGRTMQCRVADESVVVMKFRPVKPGNRAEDKTGMIHSNKSVEAVNIQKSSLLRREEVCLKKYLKYL
jgi:hypothetical protein